MIFLSTVVSLKPGTLRLGLNSVKVSVPRLGLRTAWARCISKGTWPEYSAQLDDPKSKRSSNGERNAGTWAGSESTELAGAKSKRTLNKERSAGWVRYKGTWTGSKSSTNKHLEQLKRESVVDLETDKSKDILSRTRVVVCDKECETIVDRIIEKGEPVGVDMEGIGQGTVGLIQVCDTDRNIYLFRTSLNRSLYRKGRLADLLESPYIVKILHASTVDCQAVYKDKVKMWNIYDTCVAHKIFQYQTNGTSIISTPLIGLNDLCTFCGLEENPLKKKAKDLLWKMLIFHRFLEETEDLGAEFLLYSAWDVEPLHGIYKTFQTLIDPDYQHLVQQVSDFELIRSIDEDLVKKKRENLKNVEKCGVFLSNLGHNVRKPDAYHFVSKEPGNKHVYFSNANNSANIVLDSRHTALNLYKLYSKRKLPRYLGNNAKLELVVSALPVEIGEHMNEEDKESDRVDSWVTSPRLCAEMVGIMIEAKAPIVVDFQKLPSAMAIEIYVGVMPSIKFAPTAELLIEGRLGDLLSSPDVTKVMGRLDTDNVYSMLKLLATHNVYVNNVFEIDSGWKSLDYLNHGQSFFKMGPKSIQSVCDYLGIERDASGQVSKLDWHLLCYTHMITLIPPSFRQVLAEKAKVELSIGANIDAIANKYKRNEIKEKVDSHCVHFRVLGRSYKKEMSPLKTSILEYLVKNDMVMLDYIEVERSVLVRLESQARVRSVMKDFSSGELMGGVRVAVTSPNLLKDHLEKPPMKPVMMEKLRSQIAKGLVKLKDGGLLNLMEKNNTVKSTVSL